MIQKSGGGGDLFVVLRKNDRPVGLKSLIDVRIRRRSFFNVSRSIREDRERYT
jgi:hypothetical protein